MTRPRSIELDADLLQAEPFGERPPADRDQHDVGGKRFGRALTLGRRDAHRERFAIGDAGHLRAEAELKALLLEDALALLRHLAVETRQDAVEELDHGYLRAEPPPDRADLQPDHARADDEQPLRHVIQLQRAGGGDEPRCSSIATPGSGVDFRAGGDRDRLRVDGLPAPILRRDLDLAGRCDARCAMQEVDLVLAEQERDTVDVRLNRRVLVRHHRREIEFRRADLHAELAESVARLLEHLRRVEQRLGGYAADVQAGAAGGRALVDDGDLQA